MKPTDCNHVLSFHREVFPVHYTMETVRRCLREDFLTLLLVDRSRGSEQIIGLSSSRRSWRSFDTTERVAYLCTFGIRASFRRAKLATDLLHFTCQILQNHYHTRELTLDVQMVNDPGRAFYDSFGFHIVQQKPDYYTEFEGDAKVSIFMEIQLGPMEFPEPFNAIVMADDLVGEVQRLPRIPWVCSLFSYP
jgi:ribosomal protein S18 acetylase RimI-like enzyme